MKINSIDNGLTNGLTNPSTFVGSANGMQNSEQQISDVNTFIFTVRPTLATKAIVLPLISNGTYAFWVDWGDGIKDFVRAFSQIYSGETAVRTHTYPIGAKDYTIKITGVCRGWLYAGVVSEQPKLRSIQQFGCLELINGDSQFANCANLDLSKVKDTLSTKFLTSFQLLLASSPNIGNVNLINNWNVRNITNMVALFFNDTSFNAPIGNWDVSSVTTMLQMFSGASSFNQPVNSWNVNTVDNMSSMFQGATAFNQPIGDWNVSNVANMSLMFGSSPFNQPIGSWNVSNVTNMQSMFNTATAFNQPIGSWNVSNVTNMSGMFNTTTAFNQPIGSWNVSNVTNMNGMFGSSPFNQPIGSWDVSNVTNMQIMFSGTNNLFNQDIGSWNVNKVTNFSNFMSTKTPATFSTANLDAIYNGWISRLLNPSLSISFGSAKHTSASTEGRALLSRANTSLTVSGVVNNGSGLIRITTSTAHGMVTGNKVFISAVTGTTEANGLWAVTLVNTTQVDLQSSTFSNTYISGGAFRTGYGWTIVDGSI